MAFLDTRSGRATLIAAIVLTTLGALGLLPALIGIVGIAIEGRLTWERAGTPLILVLCGAILLAGGIMLYRRTLR